jgi:hypothetical protein
VLRSIPKEASTDEDTETLCEKAKALCEQVWNQAVTVKIAPEKANPYKGFTFNTRHQGNSNSGHLYGTDLASEEKEKLVEFLKTL